MIDFKQNDFEAIEFTNNMHARIRVKPMYYQLGFSEDARILGRSIVRSMLIKALDLLPQHLGFQIWDIYRPRATQGKLFEWMRRQVKNKYPELSDAENYETAKKYMSPPSATGDAHCPPHLSGGAVDLTLYDLNTMAELDMGTPFDDCSDKAHCNYYDRLSTLTQADEAIKERRMLFANAMASAGFTAYQYEWWHFDIGNVFWSKITGCPTVFGPLFGDREWPNE